MTSNWNSIYNIFDPAVPLVGKQENLYVERDDSPLPRLRLALQPGRRSQKVLLVGQRGSGKSTTLAQLAHHLAKEYFVIWIDLNASLDVHTFTIIDLLLAMGGGIHKVALGDGVNTGATHWAEMVGAINTFLGKRFEAGYVLDQLICAKGDPSAPLDITPREPSSGQNFSLDITPKESERIKTGAFLREVLKRTNLVNQAVQQSIGKPTLMIVDGLDKIKPYEASELFQYSEILGQVDFPFVSTLPHSLYLTASDHVAEYFDLVYLPNVRITQRDKSGEIFEPGFQMMRSVCQKRLAALGIKNSDEVIEPEALNLLIKASAGIMRGVIRAFRNAGLYAEGRKSKMISISDAKSAFNDEKLSRLSFLDSQDIDFLKQFQISHQWSKSEQGKFLELFQQGAIVGYAAEGEIWYEINPVLLPLK